MASKLKQLRTLVGEGVASDQELGDLLSRCGNSVQAAANAFFDQSRPEPRASHVERGVEGLKRGQRSGSAKSAPGAKKPRKVEAPSTADIARPPHLSSSPLSSLVHLRVSSERLGTTYADYRRI